MNYANLEGISLLNSAEYHLSVKEKIKTSKQKKITFFFNGFVILLQFKLAAVTGSCRVDLSKATNCPLAVVSACYSAELLVSR